MVVLLLLWCEGVVVVVLLMLLYCEGVVVVVVVDF